jgi:hypothetical protein
MSFHSLKYTYVENKNITGNPMRIWIRNTVFFLANLPTLTPREISGFAICRLIITNLLFADWPTSKFADLRLRIDPKNLRTDKKICVPTFVGFKPPCPQCSGSVNISFRSGSRDPLSWFTDPGRPINYGSGADPTLTILWIFWIFFCQIDSLQYQ